MREKDHLDHAPPLGPHFALWLEPLGVPTVIRSASPELLAAAAEAYADWRAPGPAAAPAIELRLEAGPGRDVSAPPGIRVEGARLSLAGEGVSGGADASAGQAWAIAPAALARRPAALAADLTDTLLLFLLTRTGGRTPAHASGVLVGDVALVLAGPSGSGKSTLALAALERGLRILSDDTLYIQLRPGLRVWGFRRPLHVFPQDAPRFTDGTRLRAGKLKAVVPTPAEAWAPCADKVRLVVLERGERIALQPLDPVSAVKALGPLEPGFDLLEADSMAARGVLAAQGAWRLTLARDPAAAIALLAERFSG